MKGKFFVLEGMDGAGKGTVKEHICSLMDKASIPYFDTREPGGTPLAEEIRALLLTKREEAVSSNAELLLMQASRAQHVEMAIKPALSRGEWVLSDRFIESTWAYQGGGRSLDISAIQKAQDVAIGDFRPDFTIFLDVPTEIGKTRTAGRGEQDRLDSEKVEFFNKVRDMYLYRAENDPNIHVVDATQSIERVNLDVKKIFNQFILEYLNEKEKKSELKIG